MIVHWSISMVWEKKKFHWKIKKLHPEISDICIDKLKIHCSNIRSHLFFTNKYTWFINNNNCSKENRSELCKQIQWNYDKNVHFSIEINVAGKWLWPDQIEFSKTNKSPGRKFPTNNNLMQNKWNCGSNVCVFFLGSTPNAFHEFLIEKKFGRKTLEKKNAGRFSGLP